MANELFYRLLVNDEEVGRYHFEDDALDEAWERIDQDIYALLGHVDSQEFAEHEFQGKKAKERLETYFECEFYGTSYVIEEL